MIYPEFVGGWGLREGWSWCFALSLVCNSYYHSEVGRLGTRIVKYRKWHILQTTSCSKLFEQSTVPGIKRSLLSSQLTVELYLCLLLGTRGLNSSARSSPIVIDVSTVSAACFGLSSHVYI